MANQDIQIKIDAAINSSQASTSLRELRQSLIELRGLALQVGDTNEAALLRINEAAGQARDRINDMNDAIQASTGDPLERVGNSFNLLGSSLSNLDFGGATIGVRTLRENLNSISFSGLGSGIKSLASEFLKLGATLLTNPIFLLGGAILLIVSNFEKLKNAGGLIGDMFKTISNSISMFIGFITSMTDALGLTNTKLEKNKELTIDLIGAQRDYNQTLLDYQSTIADIENKSTIEIEYEKKKNIIDALYEGFKAKYAIGAQQNAEFFNQLIDGSATAEEAIKKLSDAVGKRVFISTEEKQSVIKDLLEYYKELGQFNLIYLVNSSKLAKEYNDINRRIEKERIDALYNLQEKERQNLKYNYDEKKRLDTEENNRRIQQYKEQDKILDQTAKREDMRLKSRSSIIRQQIRDTEKLLEKTQGELKTNEYLINPEDYNPIIKRKLLEDRSRMKKEIDDTKIRLVQLNKELEKNGKIEESIYKARSENRLRIQNFTNIEEEKFNQRQIENEKKYNQDLLDINNRYQVKKLESRLDHYAKMYQLQNSDIMRSTKATLGAYEFTRKQREIDAGKELESLKKQKQSTNEIYNLQIALAHDNADEQQRLRDKQVESNMEFWQKMITLVKNYYEKEVHYREKAAQDREKALKDDIQLKKNSIDAYITTFNSRKAINEMEQAMMQQGEERYSFNLGERIKLLKEDLKNQKEILNGEEKKSILENELTNTTNAEQRKLEIHQEYDTKRTQLEKASTKDRLLAAADESKKLYSITKSGLELWSAINTYYDTVDENRENETEQQAEQRAKAKFERNKELQLASAIVNTAAATIYPLIEGNYAGSVFAAAMGAIQIATILATQYKSTSAPSSKVTVNAPESSKPTSAGGGFLGQGFLNQQFNPNDFMNNQYRFQNGNQKVYVLESDISNMINRVAVANDRNTLRGY